MIQHNVICTQCGNISEIDKNSKSFQMVMKSYSLSEHNFNDTFGNSWSSGNKISKAGSLDRVDFVNSSFCDKDCFVEYLKQHMTDGGMIQMTKEEFEQSEEEQPKEIKELKRIAKAMSDLETMAGPTMGAHNAKSK